ncbi:MAG: UDP-N-acetylmuramoyl-tripeptide--D-alanyl-D-alanine ligase [Clostridia bacterium]|nr:UDP-N-acetylmuramoyl-tripeptide--D-alanyl-D-alanine ligase [Clostridia bacterium]
MFLPLNVESAKELFTLNIFLGFIITGFLNGLLMIAISYKFLQVLQQCGYNGREYLKWLVRKDNSSFNGLLMLSLLSVLGFVLINTSLSFINKFWVDYTGFLVYLLFLIVFFVSEFKRKEKLPLVITKRMVRLIITFVLVTVIFSTLLIMGVNLVCIPFKEYLITHFRYGVICLCPIFVPYILLLAYYINQPLEMAIISKYVKKCKQKLQKSQNLIKIAITGSYGKTSVKEILKVILSKKYKVMATPLSYNTPLGISKTVKRLDGTEDVLIAEMGARRVGDIKKLTEIVNPNVAVITGVTAQHLETFKKLENVKKTKYELIENMNGGKAVFSSDNKATYEMFRMCDKSAVLAGLNTKGKPRVYATDVKSTSKGTNFTLHVGGESVEVSTKLLGKHNVSNICLAVAVADILGLTIGEIASAICNINPIKHRLEIIESENGLTILDDSYNSNPEGVKCALDVLSEFSGNKFVVTPGIVELGVVENEENFKFGKLLAKVANGVILVGRARTLKIREGLLSEGYSTDKIYMVSSLEDAKRKLTEIYESGDVVLFENDLPDKYL